MHILILRSLRLVALGSGEPDIFLAYLRSIYSLGVLGTKTFEGKVASYKIAHKKKVLEDSDEFLTSGLPGIEDTGSGNSAYIYGLVMMNVMMRFC